MSTTRNITSSSAYNYKVVRQFAIMSVVWGIVGMGFGVFVAAQLAWPELNFNLPWSRFGHLRPLQSNAVIFAFGGCALFASSYYAVQLTSQARLFAPRLAALSVCGWSAALPKQLKQPVNSHLNCATQSRTLAAGRAHDTRLGLVLATVATCHNSKAIPTFALCPYGI